MPTSVILLPTVKNCRSDVAITAACGYAIRACRGINVWFDGMRIA